MLSYSLDNIRNFPRAMVFGLMGVAICYLLVIVSFYSVLSYSEILATKAVALVSVATYFVALSNNSMYNTRK